MRLVSDSSLCCSTAMCVEIAPKYFALGSDRRVAVLVDTPAPEVLDQIAEATELCPTGAIWLEPTPVDPTDTS